MHTSKTVIKIDPAGHSDGRAWDEKGHSQIVQIFISHGIRINSIQFQYLENRDLVLSEKFGESNGRKFDVVRFQNPSEYLVWVSGHSGARGLTSLAFGTNQGTYGPFGIPDPLDEEFRFHLGMDRQFGGFYGSADDRLQSIGVYFKPITYLPRKSQFSLDDL